MLTGRVPFDGESAGEILMKHLTSPPDLSKLPAEYIPIVGKALAKNPAQRYATIGEMAKAVEAVGAPQPQPAPMPTPASNGAPSLPFQLGRQVGKLVDQPPPAIPRPATSVRGQVGELSGSMALATVLALLLVTLYAALRRDSNMYEIGSLFFLTVGISWVVLVPSKFWDGRAGDSASRRLVMMVLGVVVGLGALWLNGLAPHTAPTDYAAAETNAGMQVTHVTVLGAGPRIETNQLSTAASYLSYFALALCIVRWWRMADRHRATRFSCWPVLVTGFWALVLLPIWPAAEPYYGTIALVTASVIVQWVSPWEAPPPPLAKRMRLRYA
jgi:hypothetical protein